MGIVEDHYNLHGTPRRYAVGKKEPCRALLKQAGITLSSAHVGAGAAAPVMSPSSGSTGAQVQKRFMSP